MSKGQVTIGLIGASNGSAMAACPTGSSWIRKTFFKSIA